MRLLISGGRHFADTAIIRKELDHIQNASPISVLIHGGLPALGVEAEHWAREHNIHVIRYPANWSLLGKHAEARRNAFMLEDSRPDIILMFPGGRQTAFFERTVRGIAHSDDDCRSIECNSDIGRGCRASLGAVVSASAIHAYLRRSNLRSAPQSFRLSGGALGL